MKISVVYNSAGDIVTAASVPDAASGPVTVGVRPGPGEHYHVLDVPKHHHEKLFSEFAHLLRVNTAGGAPRLEDKQPRA